MGTKTLLITSMFFVGFTSIAHAQDGTFRTWFETPETVMAGDTFQVRMWASFEGDLLRPEGWFAALAASFEVSGNLDTFEEVTPIVFGLAATPSAGTPDGPWLRDVLTWQVPNFKAFDNSNPVLILGFNITTATNEIGMLNIDIRPGFNYELPGLEWSVDGLDDYVRTLDPNIALIASPATVRVIPAPGPISLLTLAAFGASRRRR